VNDRRRHAVTVRLNDAELARLDDLRRGVGRAVHLRQLLYEPPHPPEIASHHEALSLLSLQARNGRVSAAIVLERALRGPPKADESGRSRVPGA
jgi:hypothetical protein